MVSIQGFMRETFLGVHTLSVYLLLYKSIFLPSMLFNSQAWSNLTDTDIKRLRVLQLKFLKRAIRAKQATSSSFVYLEMGVLPISYEIHKSKLPFLHPWPTIFKYSRPCFITLSIAWGSSGGVGNIFCSFITLSIACCKKSLASRRHLRVSKVQSDI